MNYGREPITLIEIDQPFCTRTYGTAPCAAALGTTGSHKCFNTRATCQDSANFDGDGRAAPYLSLPGTIGNFAETPNSAALAVLTGDLDIRMKVSVADWTPALGFDFLDKIVADFVQFSYLFRLNPAGTLTLYWSIDGVNLSSANSSVATGVADGSVKWLRATLDVNNGTGGNDVKFFTSDDGVTWTQLGTTQTGAITSVFAGSATLQIGGSRSGIAGQHLGNVYYAEIRNGIGGPVVAKFDPPANDAAYNASSFVSETGEVWTINTSGGTPAKLISPLLRLRFARSQTGVLDLGPAIPSLVDISTKAAAINLAGMDQSASALGSREVVTMKFDDHQHSDLLVDRYRLERQTGAASIIEAGTASAYGALQFDGAGTKWVTTPSGVNAVNISGQITIECWLVPDTSLSTQGYVEKTVGGLVNSQYLLFGEGGFFKLRLNTAGSGLVTGASTGAAWTASNGVPTHVVGVYDGVNIQMYVNGAPSGAPSGPIVGPIVTGAGILLIGQLGTGAPGFSAKGAMDEVRIYNRALSPEDIAAHFSGVYENETGLVGYWPFEEGSGTVAQDYSATANHGTLVGAPARVAGRFGRKNVLKLRAAASAVDDFYNVKYARINSGAGSGQTRQVIDYDALSKLATLDRAWGENYITWSEDPAGNWGVGDPVNPFTAFSTDIKAPDGSAPAKWTLVQSAGVNRSFSPSVAAMPATPGSTICFSAWVYIPSTNSQNPFSFYAFSNTDIPTGEFVNLNKLTRNTWQLVNFVHTWSAASTGNVNPQFHPNSADTLGDTMYVWRPSLRYGSSRGEYVRTLGSAVLAPDGTSVYSVFEDAYNPLTRGTMWGKWLARNPFYNSYRCRVYQGYAGDLRSAMRSRTYQLDSIDGPDQGATTIVAKDLFTAVEAQKSVAPLASLGELLADITAVAGSATLSPAGIGNLNYPASGNVAIGDEIITFTRAADVLTLTVRGALNTVAAAHKAEDLVQVVLSYVAQLSHDIVYDLLLNYTPLDAADLPYADWVVAAASLTGVYTARIATPTPVADLIGELAQQVGFSVWPDVSSGQVHFAALRAATPQVTVDDSNIVSGSLKLKRQTERRASQVWVYYGQVAPNRALDTKENYHSRLVSTDTLAESQFGSPAIREVFSRWIPQFGRSAAQGCGERIVALFRDPPIEADLRVKSSRLGDIALARYFYLSAAELQDEVGSISAPTMAAVEIEIGETELQVRSQQVAFVAPVAGTGERVIYIENDINDVNMRTIHDSLFAVPVGTETVRFIVVAGFTVGASSTAAAAMRTGSWPAGVTLKLDNNGTIEGCGGKGAASSVTAVGNNGLVGGDALLAERAISVDNLLGKIWGGGGGGGGMSYIAFGGVHFSGEGGGGAGALPGQPGVHTPPNNPNNFGAFAGTGTAGGGGGDNTPLGTGGAGGGPGLAGANATAANPGSGGAAGKYIVGNAFVTWVNNGDRRGGVA